MDGWIILNLYYPEESTERQWRLGKEGEIRDGYETDGWQDYTGPILVRLVDIEHIYIMCLSLLFSSKRTGSISSFGQQMLIKNPTSVLQYLK